MHDAFNPLPTFICMQGQRHICPYNVNLRANSKNVAINSYVKLLSFGLQLLSISTQTRGLRRQSRQRWFYRFIDTLAWRTPDAVLFSM